VVRARVEYDSSHDIKTCHSCEGGESWFEPIWVRGLEKTPERADQNAVLVPLLWPGKKANGKWGRFEIRTKKSQEDHLCDVITEREWRCPHPECRAKRAGVEVMSIRKRHRSEQELPEDWRCDDCPWIVCPDCRQRVRADQRHGGIMAQSTSLVPRGGKERRYHHDVEDETAWWAERLESQDGDERRIEGHEIEAGLKAAKYEHPDEAPINPRDAELETGDERKDLDRHIEDDNKEDDASRWLKAHGVEDAKPEARDEEDEPEDVEELEPLHYDEVELPGHELPAPEFEGGWWWPTSFGDPQQWCVRPVFPVTVVESLPLKYERWCKRADGSSILTIDESSVVRAIDEDNEKDWWGDDEYTDLRTTAKRGWSEVDGYKVTVRRTGALVVKWRPVGSKKYTRRTWITDKEGMEVPDYILQLAGHPAVADEKQRFEEGRPCRLLLSFKHKTVSDFYAPYDCVPEQRWAGYPIGCRGRHIDDLLRVDNPRGLWSRMVREFRAEANARFPEWPSGTGRRADLGPGKAQRRIVPKREMYSLHGKLLRCWRGVLDYGCASDEPAPAAWAPEPSLTSEAALVRARELGEASEKRRATRWEDGKKYRNPPRETWGTKGLCNDVGRQRWMLIFEGGDPRPAVVDGSPLPPRPQPLPSTDGWDPRNRKPPIPDTCVCCRHKKGEHDDVFSLCPAAPEPAPWRWRWFAHEADERAERRRQAMREAGFLWQDVVDHGHEDHLKPRTYVEMVDRLIALVLGHPPRKLEPWGPRVEPTGTAMIDQRGQPAVALVSHHARKQRTITAPTHCTCGGRRAGRVCLVCNCGCRLGRVGLVCDCEMTRREIRLAPQSRRRRVKSRGRTPLRCGCAWCRSRSITLAWTALWDDLRAEALRRRRHLQGRAA
jgi:hypothetical protein